MVVAPAGPITAAINLARLTQDALAEAQRRKAQAAINNTNTLGSAAVQAARETPVRLVIPASAAIPSMEERLRDIVARDTTNTTAAGSLAVIERARANERYLTDAQRETLNVMTGATSYIDRTTSQARSDVGMSSAQILDLNRRELTDAEKQEVLVRTIISTIGIVAPAAAAFSVPAAAATAAGAATTTTTAATTATTAATTTAAAGGAAATGAAAATTSSALGTATGTLTAATITTALTTGLKTALTGIVAAVSVSAIVSGFGLGSWMMDAMLSPVLGALTATAPTSPAIAGNTVSAIKGTMGAAMNSLLGMTIMSEMMSPLKTVGLGYLSAMMGDAAGFRPIIAGILSPHIRAAITIPTTARIYSQLQPSYLDVAKAGKAWAMGFLTDAQFTDHIRMAGYPPLYDSYFKEEADVDLGIGQIMEAFSRGKMSETEVERAYKIAAGDLQWLPVLKDLSYSSVRPTMFKVIADSEAFDEDMIRDMLRDARYRPEHVEFLISTFKLAVTSKYRSALISSLTKNYKEGLIPRGDYVDNLGRMGLRTDLVAMIAAQADWEYSYDFKMDQIKVVRDSYKKDLIATDDEEYSSLLALGVQPERADALVRIDTITKLPKATTPVQTAEEKEAAATMKIRMSVVREEFRKGVISQEEAVAQLVAWGVSEARARATIEYERVKLMPKPALEVPAEEEWQPTDIQKIRMDTIREDFKDGRITAEDLLNALLDLGVPDDRARAIVDLEVARKAPKIMPPAPTAEEREREKIVELKVRTAVENFRKDRITAEDLLDELIRLGLREERARAVTDYEVSKKVEKVEHPAPTTEERERETVVELEIKTAIEDFRDGRITAEDLLRRLLGLGVSERRAYAMVGYETARKMPKVAEEVA
jgi:hypothetical protein